MSKAKTCYRGHPSKDYRTHYGQCIACNRLGRGMSPERALQNPIRNGVVLRGTAAMSLEARIEVARKGGLKVSQNRGFMAKIGRKGGTAVSQDREHMARIGAVGGSAGKKDGGP